MSTLTLTTPHQVTVNLTAIGGVQSTQYSKVVPYATTESWTVVTAGTATLAAGGADGLRVNVTGTSATIRRTVVAGGAGTQRRVRAKVVLSDPEGRPVKVQVAVPPGLARMVSGVPVWIESDGPSAATTVDITITKPAGAASCEVFVKDVVVTLESTAANTWTLERTDSNGTALLATGYLPGTLLTPYQYQGLRGNASGQLAFVDREASLTGNVSYRLVNTNTSLDETLNTGAAGVTSTGYGVLHRVNAPTPTLHQVNVIDFSGSYAGTAQPLAVIGTDLPAVPTQPLAAREGNVVLYFSTLDAAQLVADDLRTGEVHMLRQDQDNRTAMDAYLVATSLRVDRVLTELTDPLWALTATYLETARGVS